MTVGNAVVAVPGAQRRAPAGVAAASVNWMCTPPGAGDQWHPEAGEREAVVATAAFMMAGVQAVVHEDVIFVAG